MAPKKDVVLVTGSSGCLGQHIVKLLQELDDDTAEIRLFDQKSYKNNLGHSENKKMTEFVADIRDTDKLLEAMEGVDCVMHVAAVIDLRIISDDSTMESVNVDGTRAVIEACLRRNVPRLILASTTDILCGQAFIYYGSEKSTPKPTTFMHGKYGESKWNAEDLVLKANGQLCADGKTILRTVALRPPAFYGEEDQHFVTPILKLAKGSNGRLYRVQGKDSRTQVVYVGNAAWSFLKAKSKLAEENDTVSGEAYFITDDTPITNVHQFLEPYLKSRGFASTSYSIPYWLAWIVLSVISVAVRLVNIMKVDLPNLGVLKYFCSVIFFNRAKAELRLEYLPLYKPEEATDRSLKYYKTVELR